MQLYKLTSQYERLSELDDAQDFGTALEQIKDASEDKIIWLARLIQNMEAEEKAYKEEADRLAAHARALKNRGGWLKEYVKANMEQLGLTKVQGSAITVAIQSNGGLPALITDDVLDDAYKLAILVMPVAEVPAILKHYVGEVVPNNALLRKLLGAEEEVDGAKLVRGTHIRIR